MNSNILSPDNIFSGQGTKFHEEIKKRMDAHDTLMKFRIIIEKGVFLTMNESSSEDMRTKVEVYDLLTAFQSKWCENNPFIPGFIRHNSPPPAAIDVLHAYLKVQMIFVI